MSTTVDNRVVQMNFDNREFESGIKETLKSLDELQKRLKLENASQGFANLDDEAKKSLNSISDSLSKVDFSKMADGLEALQRRFSIFGEFVHNKVIGVMNQATSAVTRFVKSISTDQMSVGFNKYATMTESVQTMISALGKSSKTSVYKAIRDLNEYSDMTSFDLASMTHNLSMFVNNGIDLSTATKAIKGIGNAASVAGVSVQKTNSIMKNFSDALAAGSMKRVDWKSMELLGFATKEVKQAFIDAGIAMGKFTKAKDGALHLKKGNKSQKAMAVTYENFAETLAAGWVDKNVMMEVLGKYEQSEEAFKAASVAHTFSEAMDAVKDAASSGWMHVFEAIFGDVDESADLWTQLSNNLIDRIVSPFSEAVGGIFDKWKELGGREKMLQIGGSILDLIFGLEDLEGENVYNERLNFVTLTIESLRDVFGAFNGEILVKKTETIRQALGKFYRWMHAEAPNGLTNMENIVKTFQMITTPVKMVSDFLKSAVGLVKDVLGLFLPNSISSLFSASSDIATGLTSWYKTDLKDGKVFDEIRQSLFEKIKNFLGDIPAKITAYSGNLKNALGKSKLVVTILNWRHRILDAFDSFKINHLDTFKSLKQSIDGFKAFFGSLSFRFSSLKNFMASGDSFTEALKKVFPKEMWKKLFKNFSKGFSAISGVFKSFGKSIWAAIKETKFGKLVQTIAKPFKKIKELIDKLAEKFKSNKKNSVTDIVKGILPFDAGNASTDVISKAASVWERIKNFFTNLISQSTGIFNTVKEKFSTIGSKVWTVISDLILKIQDWWAKVKETAGPIIEKVRTFILDFASKIPGWWESAKNTITPIIDSIKSTISGFFEKGENGDAEGTDNLNGAGRFAWIHNFIESVKVAYTNLKGQVGPIIDKIKEFFKKIFNKDDPESMASTLSANISDVTIADGIKSFFGKIGEAFSGFFEILGDSAKIALIIANLKAIATEILAYKTLWNTGTLLGGAGKFLKQLGSLDSLNVDSFSIGKLFSGEGGIQFNRKNKIRDVGTTFMEIGGTIAIILGVLGLLTLADPKRLDAAVGAFTTVITSIGALIAALTQVPNPKGIKEIGIGIASIGGSLLLAGLAIALLGSLPIPQLVQGGLAVIVLGALMVGAIVAITKLSGPMAGMNWKTILAFAGGIFILAMALKKVSKIKEPWGAVLVIAALTAIMAAAIWLVTKYGGDKLVSQKSSAWKLMAGFAASILILAVALEKVAKIENPWPAVGVIFVLSAIMAALVWFTSRYGGSKIKGIVGTFIAFAAMMYVFSKALDYVKDIPWETMLSFAGSFFIVVATLVAALEVAGATSVIIIEGAKALGAAITILGAAAAAALELVSGGLESFGTALFVLGSNIKNFAELIKDVDWAKVDKSIEYTGKLMTMAKMITTDSGNHEKVKAFGQMIQRFGANLGLYGMNINDIDVNKAMGIKPLVDQMVEISNELSAIDGFGDISTSIANLGAAIQLYARLTKGIDLSADQTGAEALPDSTDIGDALSLFSGIVDALPKEGDLAAVADFAEGGSRNTELVNFGLGLISLSEAFKAFDENTSDINQERVDNITGALERIAKISELLPAEKTEEKHFGWLTGFGAKVISKRETLDQFATDIFSLGNAMLEFGQNVSSDTIDTDKVKDACGVLERLSKIKMPTQGGILSKLFSNTKMTLGEFGSNIATLGDGFALYAQSVSGVSFKNVSKSADVIGVLSTAQANLAETGGLWSLVVGDEKLGSLASNLENLGKGVAKFGDSTKDANFTNTDSAIQAVKDIAGAQKEMESLGGLAQILTGEKDLGKLGGMLAELGVKFKEFSDNLPNIDIPSVNVGILWLRTLVYLQDRLRDDNGEYYTFSNLAYQFETFVGEINEAVKGDKLNTITAIGTAIDEMVSGLNNSNVTLPAKDIGNAFIDNMIEGLKSETSRIKLEDAGKVITGNIVNGIGSEDSVAVIKDSSERLITRICSGFISEASRNTINTGGRNIVIALKNRLNPNLASSQDISTLLRIAGENLALGIAIGICGLKGKTYVENAAWNLGVAAANSFNRSIDAHSPSRVGMISGGYFSQGVGIGINEKSSFVTTSASNLGNALINSFNDSMENGTPTIRPVVDASSFSSVNGYLGTHRLNFNTDSLSKYTEPLMNINGSTNGIIGEMQDIKDELSYLGEAMSNLRVVLDSGALVGGIAPSMDKALGERSMMRKRGN